MIQIAIRAPDQEIKDCRLFSLNLHNRKRDEEIFQEMSDGIVPSEVSRFGLKFYPFGFYIEAVATFLEDSDDASNFSEVELRVLN